MFGSVEASILECEQRGVMTSQGCKEAVIEKLASYVMKRKGNEEVAELYFDFQKAYDKVNHSGGLWRPSESQNRKYSAATCPKSDMM